ncbi:MAG: rhomboid family protein [Opitutae bacterium]|nr:rhomboid family protein [Opitutae bacterium]
MSTLAARKCVRHTGREAIARCPSCGGDFCRECIVEHGGRVLCAACLAKEAKPPAAAPRGRAFVRATSDTLLTLASVLALWIAFYAFGQFLKALPPDLHEGTVWQRAMDVD